MQLLPKVEPSASRPHPEEGSGGGEKLCNSQPSQHEDCRKRVIAPATMGDVPARTSAEERREPPPFRCLPLTARLRRPNTDQHWWVDLAPLPPPHSCFAASAACFSRSMRFAFACESRSLSLA